MERSAIKRFGGGDTKRLGTAHAKVLPRSKAPEKPPARDAHKPNAGASKLPAQKNDHGTGG